VAIVVPAYRERHVIKAKVENALENGYDGTVEVLVIADDPDTAAAAVDSAARVVDGHEREGKANALNLGVREATQPIVVLTDANAMLRRGALTQLVRWLDDPTIGAVTGEKRVATTGGDGAYWAFESWLKRREFRTGTTVGLCGELVALRRDDYEELPANVAVDDLWIAMDVDARGQRIAYEPGATVIEPESETTGIEWERRTRIVAGALDAMWRRRARLAPGSSPLTPQLWGHRLIRSSVGPLAHAVLLAGAVGSLRRSRLARLFVLVHLAGVHAHWQRSRGGAPGRGRSALAHVLFLQAVAVGGTMRWLRGDRLAVWPKGERAAPSEIPAGVRARRP
jgi:hypothetical protein